MLLCILGSILLGYTDTDLNMLINAYTNFDGSMEQLIIKTTRVPRALIATFIGASLGIAGVLMQSITKNPMASPSLLGVNSGASFFLVIAISFFPKISFNFLVYVAFVGAFIATAIVYTLAGGLKGDVHTINLTLAGAAITFLFSSFTQGVLAQDQKTLEETLFWLSGSIEGRSIEILIMVIPYLVVGWIASILISKKLNILALGEETAVGLGQNTRSLKLIAAVSIVILAGASVSVAGPITLIGLITPHLAKTIVGSDYRWIVPYSGVLGAVFLIISDIGARFVIYPKEVPVGVMTALIGAPFFIYIARKAENK
ncbi:iron chelate uptake ABC transporter family permease subunit [Clostridium bovifaecis]|uniref:Iron chelate uptake ABC transporter family permease subunit n=1 Tax=Clostridium bovifaecis TaxID=2184719 RepID=A0A6I6FG33_9CLOT|nr:iron chelate uptake ABC transporter family permease subunit [Clostridium bovifaecis]